MAETQLLAAEQLMRLLDVAVDQAKEAVLITSAQLDPPGPEILFVNPALCDMTGYSQEEVLHKTPRILQGPKSDRAMLTALARRAEPRRAIFRRDRQLSQGRRRILRGMGHHADPRGQRRNYSFLSIQRNVTARKLAEDQLREMFRQVERSRNDLGSILNELRIGTAMTDENGHVVFLNAAARRLFGRPESAAVQAALERLIRFGSGKHASTCRR